MTDDMTGDTTDNTTKGPTDGATMPQAHEMHGEATERSDITSQRTASRGAVIAVAALFGVLYAWDLWEAVSTAVELPVFYEVYGFDVSQLPWWVLVLMIALPPVVFAGALWLGRGRALWQRAVLLLVGLAVVAALTLGLVALEAVLRPGLLSGVL